MSSCRELHREPAVSTGTVINIAMHSAEVYGYLIDSGEEPAEYGHCYGKTSGVTIDSSRTKLGIPNALGNFLSNLTNLEAGTEYFIKAYVTDGLTTAYGNETTFTTDPAFLPELTTTDISSITSTSAVSGGNITWDGGAPVTKRGVCWRLADEQDPTTDDDITTDGAGTGDFTSNISGLTPGTFYTVRAYATNRTGTEYGIKILFRTNSSLPVLTTVPVSSLTSTSATCGGNITFNGGAYVTERGVCWSTSPNPTIADGRTVDGEGSGSFISEMDGLQPNETYYVRAYAINAIGITYANDLTFKTYTGSVADYDGNIYNTITIGSQVVFRENLKVTHYRNGEPIINITDSTAWVNDIGGAYCWYENKIENKEPYGALYNFYAVENVNGICPAGWHVFTNDEWNEIANTYGQPNVAGGFLKDTTLWRSPNSGANNVSGFTALPAGIRGQGQPGSQFYWKEMYCMLWTSTEDANSNKPYGKRLCFDYAGFDSWLLPKHDGYSIRCIKD
ncbi:MAG: fibrobacter succinogenes major paralogous domain-containing protein [Bacteroidales bacterium]|nr:fibrobacter succinogenes major paralogous domain-containing protein [Bacteroidales bacterium]